MAAADAFFSIAKTPFGAHEIKVMHEIDCGDIAYANFIQRIITVSMIHCSGQRCKNPVGSCEGRIASAAHA